MKRSFILTCLLLINAVTAISQAVPYKVVFDLTGSDTLEHRAVIRWLNEITSAHKDANLEVVMYAKGLDLVTKGKTNYADAVMKMMDNKNVSFKVCAVAMKNLHVEKNDLLPGVEIVPDGIYEVITKQSQGWGYIKVAL